MTFTNERKAALLKNLFVLKKVIDDSGANEDELLTALDVLFPDSSSNNLQNGGFESYQNSAMSVPVMAYVYRDSNNNIVRVYEPIRQNDVCRGTLSDTDYLDKFPFDNENWYKNTFNNTVLKRLGQRTVFTNTNCINSYIDLYGRSVAFNNLKIFDAFIYRYGQLDAGVEGLIMDGGSVKLPYLTQQVKLEFNSSIGGFESLYGLATKINSNTITVSGDFSSSYDSQVFYLYDDVDLDVILDTVSAVFNNGTTTIVFTQNIPSYSGSLYINQERSFYGVSYVKLDLNSSVKFDSPIEPSLNSVALGASCQVIASGDLNNKDYQCIAGITYEKGVTEVSDVLYETLTAV